MIVDIGGGTTEVAVISLAGIVYAQSTRMGGDKMDEAIVQYIRKKYNLQIGERWAEKIKLEIGEAYPGPETLEMEDKGRDLVTGIPKTIKVNSDEIRDNLRLALAMLENNDNTVLQDYQNFNLIRRGAGDFVLMSDL